ncbi:hypothetical protein HK100_004928 [Physocladia obscura]|uniref:Peptidase A1 domain-containing protein n=1 Tax=Physocladia obscura TaxID=109957 RepID=A0AAD5T664_9FUNG|nr:hypothetical protein HK100_004928 [Physocladia obscura]
MRFEDVPVEIKQEIILYLPIDCRLIDVLLISHAFYYALNDTTFVSNHLLRAKQRDQNLNSVWPDIHKHFPFAYASASLVLDKNLLANWPEIESTNFLAKLKSALQHLGRTPHWSRHTTGTISILAAACGCVEALDLLLACGNSNASSNVFLHGIPLGYLARIARAEYSNFYAEKSFSTFAERVSEISAVDLGSFLMKFGPTEMGDADLIGIASKYGRDELVAILLADPSVDPASERNYAIKWAAREGHANAVRLLLADDRVNPSADLNYAIKWASREGHTEVVEILLADERVNPAGDFNYAVKWASRQGRSEIVQLLLAVSHVNPGAGENFAIKWASRQGHAEVVKLLLADRRVNPAADDNFAIKWASRGGQLEVVKFLMADHRVNPAAEDNFAVRWASRQGCENTVRLLLTDSRVNPSADFDYAIKRAAMYNHVEVVKLLLSDKRVDPAADSNYAIKRASMFGYAEVVKLLLVDLRVDPSSDNNFALKQASKEDEFGNNSSGFGNGGIASSGPVIQFTLGSVAISINPAEYVLNQGGSCASGISQIGQLSGNGPVYIFGDVFLRAAYSVFDIQNNQLGFAQAIHG